MDKSLIRRINPQAVRDFAPYGALLLATLVAACAYIASGDYYLPKRTVAGIMCLFIAIGVIGLFVIGRRNSWKQEFVFLFVYALFGILTMALIPPNSTPDYDTLYLRAYEIAQGRFVTPIDVGYSTYLPGNLAPFIGKDEFLEMSTVVGDFGRTISPSYDTPYTYYTGSLYSPVVFIPASLGIFIAQLFSNNTWVLLYAAQFANWLAVGSLLFFSVRIMPIGKTPFTAAALVPICLEFSTAISSDMPVVALIYVLFAYVMHLRFTRKPASVPLLALIVACVSLAKIVYLPVCLLALLIPSECFPSRKAHIAWISVLAVMAVALNLIWLAVASNYLLVVREGVNSGEQVAFMLGHPLSFAGACAQTTLSFAGEWVMQIFGSTLNILDVHPHMVFPCLLLVTFCYLCFRYASPQGKLDAHARALILVVVLIVSLLTFASLYVQWTPVQANLIEGIQGRYFIPLLPLAMTALFPETDERRPSASWVFYFCILAIIMIAPLEVSL